MAEGSEILDDSKLPKLFSSLTPQQKDIYRYLLTNHHQKALNIARAVKKQTAKEVNPDLYTMKKMKLLEHNSCEKLWDIKAEAAGDFEVKANYESEAGTEQPIKTIPLTELQESIITILKSSKPLRAKNIAKALGKMTAKEVNPDLYIMKGLNLLSLDEQEKLWTINTGFAHPLSEFQNPNCNQPQIETDGCKISNNKDSTRDSSINMTSPHSKDTMRNNQQQTGSPTERYLQNESQLSSAPQHVVNNYNIYACQSFTIGDTTWQTKGEAELIRKEFINIHNEYRDPHTREQEVEQQENSTLGQQTEDDTLSEMCLANYEEHKEPFNAPHPFLPKPSCGSEQTLEISGICDRLGNVTLDKQDDHSEECVVNTEALKLTFGPFLPKL